MMKKVIKKVVAKASVKKTVAKKPMMKYGGAKRTLRKYQGDEKGSAVGPGGGSAPAPKRSFADAYKANLDAGLRKGQARKIAMVETGIKEQKKRIDPNTVINAIGNTAGAVGSVANAFRKPVAGSTTSGPGVNPGSTSIGNQNPEMEFEKRGGAIKKKGGAMKKLGCAQCGKAMKKGGAVKKMAKGGSTLSGSAIKKAPTYMYGMPQENMGTSGQYGMMKKGGSTSVINRAVKPGCRGGMVKDANGNCVPVRKAKVGGSLKPVPTDKVGLSKLPTAVRNKMGYQKSGGTMKKAAGGPIIDKLKAKLTERKVTKAIKKSVKSSGKIVK